MKTLTTAPPTPQTMTVRQASVALGCSPQTVRKLIRSNSLAVTVRVGGLGKFFVLRDSVDAFLRATHTDDAA